MVQSILNASPWILLFGLGWGFGFRLFMAIRRARTRAQNRGLPMLPMWTAALAAHRRCGGCGYSLREVEPGEGGFARCPECGSSWHKDRWTMQDRDATQSALLIEAYSRSQRHDTGLKTGFTSDDRGVPLVQREFTLESWLKNQGLFISVARSIRARDRLAGLRNMRIAMMVVPIGGVAGVVLTYVLAGGQAPDPGTVTSVVVFICIICPFVVYWAYRTGLSGHRLRALILSHGACPCCGVSFPPGKPVQFDGCIVCNSCGRAWKREAGAVVAPH